MKITIGADPELFLFNGNTPVSAHDVIPGTKLDPYRIEDGYIQHDGTAFEFNVTPADTPERFTESIASCIREGLYEVYKKHKHFHFEAKPTVTFESRYLENLPPEAKNMGCEPDMNAWTGEQNTPPDSSVNFRTGGGHIHIGWTEKEDVYDPAHIFDCEEMVKQLDATLYHMSILWDDDQKRRQLYGKMGSYRAKNFGVEYRPLSNKWVSDPNLHRYVFEVVTLAHKDLENNIKWWEDDEASGLIRLSRKDMVPVKSRLLSFHSKLVKAGYPSLPDKYLEGV